MDSCGEQQYSKKLLRSLIAAGDRKNLDFFQKLEDNNERVLFIENLLRKYNLIPNFDGWKLKKDMVISDVYRNEGNKFYREKKFLDALEHYNKR